MERNRALACSLNAMRKDSNAMNEKYDLRRSASTFQRNEITESHIYRRLARIERSPENRKVLERISDDELRHYEHWKTHTGTDVAPNLWKVRFYCWAARILGLTFSIKLMERGEDAAQENYAQFEGTVEGVDRIVREEGDHEQELLNMLDEERLRYVGSIVLGLNDALVELTGALAGLTLALRNTPLIALSGLIVGIAAAMSMAASEYLSTKEEKNNKEPFKSSLYTGMAYVVTVFFLIVPYLFVPNPFICLAWTLIAAVGIIAAFNYYISVATERPFKKHFLEMTGVSLGVAALSFGMGYVVRAFLGVDV